jgi:phosphoribosylglycinamide formyltransferase-1
MYDYFLGGKDNYPVDREQGEAAAAAFPGLDTHARALAAGVKLHGCTVHFVSVELDHGPIVIQAAVPVRADDTAATLAARVLRQEHVIYPLAARWFLDGKLVRPEAIKVMQITA